MSDLPDKYEFRGDAVPGDVMVCMHKYINHHEPVDMFLQAVIANDLALACAHANQDRMDNLRSIVMFLYNEAPGNCWGSAEKYLEWICDHF